MRFARKAEDSIASHTYPTTTRELAAEHGDVEIALSDGAVTLGELLGRFPDQKLETADDARLLTYSAFGQAAVGRKGYSDRDPPLPGELGHEQVSF